MIWLLRIDELDAIDVCRFPLPYPRFFYDHWVFLVDEDLVFRNIVSGDPATASARDNQKSGEAAAKRDAQHQDGNPDDGCVVVVIFLFLLAPTAVEDAAAAKATGVVSVIATDIWCRQVDISIEHVAFVHVLHAQSITTIVAKLDGTFARGRADRSGR